MKNLAEWNCTFWQCKIKQTLNDEIGCISYSNFQNEGVRDGAGGNKGDVTSLRLSSFKRIEINNLKYDIEKFYYCITTSRFFCEENTAWLSEPTENDHKK